MVVALGRALTRMDLDTWVCGNANCKARHQPLVVRSRCHGPDGPTLAVYDRDADPGVLQIICAECETLIARVRVAAEG